MSDAMRRHFIGADRALRFAELANQNTNYPPHNVIQTGDNSYRVAIAVAGFSSDEITVEVEGDLMTVKGTKANEAMPDHWTVLYAGIAFRDFTRQFRIGEYVEVESAELVDGLLVINLVREIPEPLKPKRIAIGRAPTA